MNAGRRSPPAPLRARLYWVKVCIARVICHPVIGRIIAVLYRDRIPNGGSVVFTDSDAVVPAIKASLYWGLYEAAELRFIHRYLRSGLDVVELGSSLGVVSSHISRKLRPEQRLVCVEANPHLLPLILKNVQANSAGARVEIVQAAIHYSGNHSGHVNFSLNDDNTMSRVTEGPASRRTIEVAALTLSEILEMQHVADYVLVCDIEGAEAGLIECDARALEHCQQLIIELHAGEWQGQRFTIYQLLERFEKVPGFRLRDQYGPVCLFERSSS